MEFVRQFNNIQYFSEQSVEALHRRFELYMARFTSRNENLKLRKAMEWQYLKNSRFDLIQDEEFVKKPLPKKQRAKMHSK